MVGVTVNDARLSVCMCTFMYDRVSACASVHSTMDVFSQKRNMLTYQLVPLLSISSTLNQIDGENLMNDCVLPKTSPLLKEDQYSINRVYMPARASKYVFYMYV